MRTCAILHPLHLELETAPRSPPPTLLFTFLGMILCVFGLLMVLQMAIVLGRFSAQIAL